MNTSDKVKAFEYLSDKFFDWFKDISNGEPIEENFSKLKLIKLHFFACAVTSNPKDEGLLSQFDEFYAMPYGHVESSVYGNLDQIRIFNLNKNSIERKSTPDDYFEGLPLADLDKAIESLRKRNQDIVKYSPMQLVDLSHSWNSWTTMYNLARQLNKFSIKIPTQMIQNENKVFILN